MNVIFYFKLKCDYPAEVHFKADKHFVFILSKSVQEFCISLQIMINCVLPAFKGQSGKFLSNELGFLD